ncbi:MAG: acyl-ACP--UDP-N-acetylglucosamine O-acyltransferase, partial [Alphaproteobacteria bacterium]|nr:acyl-ACP--UDP-N-acetylglucosamine O-acyltransferase [Alphaproteobacteria bacterium]
MPQIHPTAIVAPGATLAEDVVIGPYCVVGDEVVLGRGVRLIAHVVVDGRTRIGERTRIFPFASIGLEPQDLKYRGERSTLEVGRHNTIREHVTMNPGTEGGGMVTHVGDHGLFMVGAHVAHDCQIGDHVIMANNATLAGHVVVGDYALLGGLSAVHQFVRIGPHAMIGGMSGVERDVIPYGQVMGDRARLSGLNIIGMQRRGFSREEIQALRSAYQFLFSADGTFNDRVNEIAERFGG